jgi:hypothetical protein
MTNTTRQIFSPLFSPTVATTCPESRGAPNALAESGGIANLSDANEVTTTVAAWRGAASNDTAQMWHDKKNGRNLNPIDSLIPLRSNRS